MTSEAPATTLPLVAANDTQNVTEGDKESVKEVQRKVSEGGLEEDLVEEKRNADQDKTLVGIDDIPLTIGQAPSSAKHTKSESKASLSSTKIKDTTGSNEPWDPTSWVPFQDITRAASTAAGDQTLDTTLVVEKDEPKEKEEGDIADSTFLKPSNNDGSREEELTSTSTANHSSSTSNGNSNTNASEPLKVSTLPPSPLPTKRPSALQLKPPSPQPWDLIEPPEDNMKGRALNFASAQDARTPTGRPLVPKSSYYFGPPASDSAYGTPPMGRIGVHHPREIIRVERDYTGGEVIQFAPIYALELENRLTPTQFLESINSINELLISAHSLRHAFMDNLITVLSLQLSRLFMFTHFQKELKRLRNLIEDLNVMLFNPVGLNILWPGDVAFLFLEIEYY